MEFLAHLPTLTSFALTLMLTLVLPSLMERLRLPGPVGYILAGIILGPQVLSVLNPDGKIVGFFADIGKLLLMFFAGFEVDIEQFNRARRKAATFGLVTFAMPFLLGAGVGWAMGYSPNACAVMYALTVPQVAATLAVALVAYSTRNAAGQRLIDEPVLNATVVLVILSSLIGLVLAGRATRRLEAPQAAPATSGEAA